MSLNHPYWGIGADLVITTNGSNYDALLRYNGTEIKRTNSSISTLINWAKTIIGNSVVIEFGVGQFTIDAEVLYEGNNTVVRGQGMNVTQLIGSGGLATDIIDLASDDSYWNCKVHDLSIDGNGCDGCCINALRSAGAGTSTYKGWRYEIYNVHLTGADSYGLQGGMDPSPSTPQIRVFNIRAYGNGGPQLYFKGGYDSVYDHLWASSMSWDGGCTKAKISNCYVGGTTNMIKISGNQIVATNIGIDNINAGNYALRVYGDGNDIRCLISNYNGAAHADDAIRISGDANYIHANITDDDNAAGMKWNYIVSEAAGSDLNYIEIMDPYDLCFTGKANLVGVSSSAVNLI